MDFNDSIKIILQNEGGYVNDPNDPGGETNFGISKNTFPKLDIKNLTREQAEQIYFDKFWTPLNLGALNNDLLKLQIFDMAVNAGQFGAVELLQGILGIKRDGIIGKQTIFAANTYINQDALASLYIQARKDEYKKKVNDNPCLSKYLKGWDNRVDNTTAFFYKK